MKGETTRRTRIGFVLATLLAVTAVIGGQSAGASADSGGPKAVSAPGPSADELERQERMFSVFDPFYSELSSSPWGHGFAQAQASEGIRSLTIYWHRPIPQQVRDFAANDVFPAQVEPARHSVADLGRLARSINARWNPRWGTYVGIHPEIGLNSFSVSWTPNKGVKLKDVARPLERSVAGIGDSIRLRATHGLIPAADWRWNDSRPWNAGGGLALDDGSPANTWCTLGPAALVNGVERFLTAGHCGWHTYVDGTGATIGSTSFNSSAHDYQFVAANASGKVFVGAWNNYSGPTRNIGYLGGNAIGTWVCNEGANSGEHCSLKVSGSDLDANGWTLWTASNPFDTSQVVNVGGDSGAPVVTPGEIEATARGLNVGYWTSQSCSGVSMRLDTHCGSESVYYSLSQILNHHGATLITY